MEIFTKGNCKLKHGSNNGKQSKYLEHKSYIFIANTIAVWKKSTMFYIPYLENLNTCT